MNELKALLAERRLPVSGKKSDLNERLEEYLEDQEGEDEDEDDEEDEEGEGQGEGRGGASDDEEGGDDEERDENVLPRALPRVANVPLSTLAGGDGDFPLVDEKQPPQKEKKRMVVIGKQGRNNTFGMSLSLHPLGQRDDDDE